MECTRPPPNELATGKRWSGRVMDASSFRWFMPGVALSGKEGRERECLRSGLISACTSFRGYEERRGEGGFLARAAKRGNFFSFQRVEGGRWFRQVIYEILKSSANKVNRIISWLEGMGFLTNILRKDVDLSKHPRRRWKLDANDVNWIISRLKTIRISDQFLSERYWLQVQ